MFCNKPKSVNRSVPGKKSRKRKKKPTHHPADNKLTKTNQSNLNLAHAMSTWAQNYTAATTWQLKHQIAYWKSRAIALQYENKILHEMIRETHFKQPAREVCNEVASDASSDEEDSENEDEEDEDLNEGDEENDNFEVSEEFIEFLKQNAKFKEEARRERERLKAKHERNELEELVQEEKLESSEEKQARLTELYGDNWEKILALETSVLCTFISECDRGQPEYWPNIPFNFTIAN